MAKKLEGWLSWLNTPLGGDKRWWACLFMSYVNQTSSCNLLNNNFWPLLQTGLAQNRLDYWKFRHKASQCSSLRDSQYWHITCICVSLSHSQTGPRSSIHLYLLGNFYNDFQVDFPWHWTPLMVMNVWAIIRLLICYLIYITCTAHIYTPLFLAENSRWTINCEVTGGELQQQWTITGGKPWQQWETSYTRWGKVIALNKQKNPSMIHAAVLWLVRHYLNILNISFVFFQMSVYNQSQ